MVDCKINNSNVEKSIVSDNDLMNKVYVERLERCVDLSIKSNEWKMNYENFQLAKDITQNSIIVSKT